MNGYDILSNHLISLNGEMEDILRDLEKQPDLGNDTLIEMRNRYIDLQNTIHFLATFRNQKYPPKIVPPGSNGSGLKITK